MLPRSIRQ
ncbi:unnamed protein product [Linum tenue]|uniref:Uncharacterized protein n=1 Tax=Linum tenue TaxID=586396 RepID=A0AAV0KGB5_9ROSI|nr:unnamed protein product [Linum tenue]